MKQFHEQQKIKLGCWLADAAVNFTIILIMDYRCLLHTHILCHTLILAIPSQISEKN